MQLTAKDVQNLISDTSNSSRYSLATKVSSSFSAGEFNETETKIAFDIFRLLLEDADKSIRLTLAENLYNAENAPHDVIFKLACDESDISSKILQYSMALTDDDLINIIQSTKKVLSLCAIARRSSVSEVVSDSLLATGQEQVLSDLFHNVGANFSKDGLERAWAAFSGNNSLLTALVHHGGLPVNIAEKIYALVSDDLKIKMMRDYNLSATTASKVIIEEREWALLGIVPINNRLGEMFHPDNDEQVEELVNQLYISARLSHSLIVRALCMGFLNLFEASIAKMAGVPRVNGRILIMSGSTGFHAIYRAAKMPEGFMDAVEKLLNIALELSEYGFIKPDNFRKRVIEKVYVNGYNRSVDGMSYLLSIIGGKMTNDSVNSALSETV